MADDSKCPMWMVSFGDCMSLLVTFFVMLIAFTNMEESNLVDTLNAMKGALGVVDRPVLVREPLQYDAIGLIKGKARKAKWLTVSQLSNVLPDAEMAVERFGRAQVGGLKKMVYAKLLDEGLAFIIHIDPVFKEGSIDLKGHDYDELWRQISSLIATMDNEVRIVCALPEDARVSKKVARTPIGLSIERAAVIENAIRNIDGLESARFSISGKVCGHSLLGFPDGWLEIIILGKRLTRGMTPEEIIVNDRWK